MGHLQGITFRFIIREKRLINVTARLNKLWSFIKQFTLIKVKRNSQFFLQIQLIFLENLWIDWNWFDYGLFKRWNWIELVLYFPNIIGKCCVCGKTLVITWHPVVVKTLFKIIFGSSKINFVRVFVYGDIL